MLHIKLYGSHNAFEQHWSVSFGGKEKIKYKYEITFRGFRKENENTENNSAKKKQNTINPEICLNIISWLIRLEEIHDRKGNGEEK